jgi:hypothetical protein
VAIGGGEPTKSLVLQQFVEDLTRHGITPNITTKNLEWFRNPPEWALKNIGAVAFSASNTTSIRTLVNAAKVWGNTYSQKRAIIQVIDGIVTADYLKRLRKADLPITVLGFKGDGLGSKYISSPKSSEYLQNAGAWTKVEGLRWGLRIDTALAEQYSEFLKNASGLTYTASEGKFSMYIDAVKMTMSSASYGSKQEIPLVAPKGWDQIMSSLETQVVQAFSTF